MSSYGDLSLDLILNSNGNIYLVFRNKRISMLDSNGNLNVKIKSIIKSGTPGTNSDNGIYYDGNNVYIKFGNDIKNITGQNSSQLPQGSIIRFKGNKNNPPAGWYYYGDTDMSGVIYIINMDIDPYTVSEVKLSWNPDLISTSLHDLGFILPTLQKQNPGNVPLSIEYSSDNPLVATIDGNGNITLKSAGSANIKAITYANSLHNMSQASYILTINKDEVSASFALNSKTITVGESFIPSVIFKLNNLVYNGSVGDYYFTSNNSNVTLINGTNIIGKSEGTAKIKIHLNLNNWHDSFVSPDDSVLTLTVKSNEVAVESVTVSPSSFEVLSGGTQLLTATVLPSNATNKTITWSIVSGNATINLNGLLTAGNVSLDSLVIVKATANNGINETCIGTIKAISLPDNPGDDDNKIDLNTDISKLAWASNNYIMDTVIDSYFVHNWNMGQHTMQNGKQREWLGWDQYDKDKREKLVNIAVVPNYDDLYVYGDPIYVTYSGIEQVTREGLTYNRYGFNKVNSYNSSDLNNYKLEGPFSTLNDPDYLPYLTIVLKLGDFAARDPAYSLNYGRVRPLGSISKNGGNRVQDDVGNIWNSIYSSKLVSICTNDLSLDNNSDINSDKATSYPSGHASQTWAVAMILAQVYGNSDDTIKYAKKAYWIGVSRTIGRFHWNSDTMLGRVWATMILPIINSIADFVQYYGNLCNKLNPSNHDNNLPTDSNYSNEFNNLLNEFTSIIGSVNSNVKNYLWSMYQAADSVLNTNGHRFLSLDTYPEEFPYSGYKVNIEGQTKLMKYRGNNIKYYYGDTELNITRSDIMLSWLMAMCLTELYFDGNDTSTHNIGVNYTLNKQTQLFAKAYEIGGGRKLDLYHEYRIDYDPTILRLAAGLVYATERGKYSFNKIRSLSSNTLGISLNVGTNPTSVNEAFGCLGDRDTKTYTVKYGINTYYIFNDGAGPHSTAGIYSSSLKNPYTNKSVGTTELNLQHQHESLFFLNSGGNSNSISFTPCSDGGSSGSGINIVIHNNTGSDISIENLFGFRLSWTSSDGSAMGPWFCKKDSSGNYVISNISNGGTLELNNLTPINMDNKYLGRNFASDNNLALFSNEYNTSLTSNFEIYNSGHINNIYIPNKFSTSETFTEGKTYHVYIGGSTASYSESNGSGGSSSGECTQSTLIINNNSGGDLTFDGRIRFIMSNNSRSSSITLGQGNNISVANGSSTSINFILNSSIDGYNTSFRDMSTDFVEGEDTYNCNVILYSGGIALYTSGLKLPSSNKLVNGTYTVDMGGGGGSTPDTPTPGDNVLFGQVNITLVNNSGIDFDGRTLSHTNPSAVPAAFLNISNNLRKLILPYMQGHISVLIALKLNSSKNDLTLDANNNPLCRSESFNMNNGQTLTFTNTWFKVNSEQSEDFLPPGGKAFESSTSVKFYIDGISNGDYAEYELRKSLIATISGENGMFKNGGTYTITIS